MAWTPIKLRKGGDVTFVGEAEGAGSTPEQAIYGGNPVTVNDGLGDSLTWDTLLSGTALLDTTSLEFPTYLADGVYAETIVVQVSGLTAAGSADVQLLGPVRNSEAQLFPVAGNLPVCTISVVQSRNAGDSPTVAVANFDGAAARDFTLLSATIVKLH